MFRVKCFVRKELRLLEWKELRLLEWREFRVKCFVRKELAAVPLGSLPRETDSRGEIVFVTLRRKSTRKEKTKASLGMA